MTFLCDIPGVDAATAAWHSIVHLGLTVVVTLSGTGFLARALVVYRRTTPTHTVTPGEADPAGVRPDAGIARVPWAHPRETASTAR